jgi:uncharacterized membrane protein YccC
MATQTPVMRPTGLRAILHPAYRPSGGGGRPWWKPSWSLAAALRGLRATLVVPGLLALTFKVMGAPQMAIFAVFGSFGALVLTTFGGARTDKLIAHLGLGVAGSIALILGTLAGGSAWLAALITLPVAFAVYFAGAWGPNTAAGVTATLLAYILPVASGGGTATIPDRLVGWWLATIISAALVLVMSPPAAGNRLRQSAASLASALGHCLQAAADGTATAADLDAALAAKQTLISEFASTPYRPVGLAAADQGLAGLVNLLEWCTSLASEAMDGHLDLTDAGPEDRDLLAESATSLRSIAELLEGRDSEPAMEPIWKARLASAVRFRQLAGDPARVRTLADHAFHAQAIGICVSAAVGDALIAARRMTPEAVSAWRQRWLAANSAWPGADPRADPGFDPAPARDRVSRPRSFLLSTGRAIAVDASLRSVWVRNSARGAAALAVAVLVARLTGVQHGFWVVLGTLSVLRSSAGATGVTALRALAGTVAGFVIGAALLVGIGTSPAALWIALPVAVLVAAYAPGTMPFAVGQAAFTVTVVVLFNILVPAGWKVGLLRVEDVAIGCAVSVVVGALFWPRGASAVVGDNLADALRSGAAYLTDAASWVLGLPTRNRGQGAAALAAGVRLDDAVRGFLTEQGSKRIDKHDLWTLSMAALRLRLTAHSLASLPGLEVSRGPAAEHPPAASEQDRLAADSGALAGFYGRLAAEVDRPAHGAAQPQDVPVPEIDPDTLAGLCRVGPVHVHPEALWVRDHLIHLASHSAELVGPATRLAALRRTPWWR